MFLSYAIYFAFLFLYGSLSNNIMCTFTLRSIIHGAVSSSAPLQATLDFSKYYDHVAWDLADETVGGSEQCRKIFEEGHAQVVDALEGRSFPDEHDAGDVPVEYIVNLFNVCDGVDAFKIRRNVEVFMGDGIVSGASQENDPSCKEELCNIQKVSKSLIFDSLYGVTNCQII